MENLMEKIVSLCKRRGFVFPGSEIYGGLANSWDYGPLGVELKNNIKKVWWERFVHRRDDVVGIDAALIMNPNVWEASGHLSTFSDPLIECEKCNKRFRVEEVNGIYFKNAPPNVREWVTFGEKIFMADETVCPYCGAKGWDSFKRPRQFNLMLETFIGPVDPLNEILNASQNKDYEKAREDIQEIYTSKFHDSLAYFRPETAQGMFVNFKNVLETTRKRLPFGIAQIGKAFRNEITPKNFIYRMREFEQMEIEYFIRPPQGDGARPKGGEDWKDTFEVWRKEMVAWMEAIGIDTEKIHELDVPKEERSHYSKRTIDFEYDYPFGRRELYGLAYRTDFDLQNHEKASGVNLKYKDPETGEEFWPHVIEPTWGVDRSILAVLLDAYSEQDDRVVLKLKPQLAPFKAAVFPLLANKLELVKLARKIYEDLRKQFIVDWDDRGNIGKRYYAQDEIGTPYCITVDFDSLEKNDVTVRNRDTAKQERIAITELKNFLHHAVFD